MKAIDFINKIGCEEGEQTATSMQYHRGTFGKPEYVEVKYDPSLWEPKKLPDHVIRTCFREDRNVIDGNGDICEQMEYLHYIGPLDAEITLPWQAVYYHTFENRTDITELPYGVPTSNYWEPFYGCSNLRVSKEEADSLILHIIHDDNKCGGLFDHCGSNTLLDRNTTQKEYLERLIGVTADFYEDFTNSIGMSLQGIAGVCMSCESLSGILTELGERIQDIPDHDWVTTQCGYIKFKHISLASEMEDLNTLVVKPGFIIKSSCKANNFVNGLAVTVIVYILNDDFVNDTMD